MIGYGPIPEVHEKMRMVRQLSDQIAELHRDLPVNEKGHDKFTHKQALALQTLQQRRAELLATLPKLHVITRDRRRETHDAQSDRRG